MISSACLVPTAHASRYLQQLCKHWSHKLTVSFTPESGTVELPEGAVLQLVARLDNLDLDLGAPDAGTLERMKGVVQRHLDRFAFREAPLVFDWRDAD